MRPLFILLTPFFIFASCGSGSSEETAPAETKPQKNMLRLNVADRQTMGIEFTPIATIDAKKTIVVPAKAIVDQERTGAAVSLVDGRIREVYAKLGTRVTQGQVLATVESMQTGALFAEALRSQSELVAARKEHERLKLLHSDNVTSEKSLQRAESDYIAAKALFDASIKQLSASGMTNDEIAAFLKNPETAGPELAIRAPISGTVSMRNASKGSRVQATEELFVIINNASVTVEGNVYQDDLGNLKPGMTVEFRTPSYPGRIFTGTLGVVSPILDAESHTLPVRCSFSNPDGALKPNLTGELRIQTGAVRRVLSVPSESIVYDGNDTFVFRDAGNEEIEYAPVEVGESFGNGVEIVAGLAPGDRIVANGVFMLKSKYKLSQSTEE